MGDHERCDGPGYFPQVSSNLEFGDRIERRRGFIENIDSRSLDRRPRDRQTLPFSSRQLEPALPDVRVVGIGQARDEFVKVRPACRPLNLLLRATCLPLSPLARGWGDLRSSTRCEGRSQRELQMRSRTAAAADYTAH